MALTKETIDLFKSKPAPVSIVIGNHMTVQGQFVKDTADGKRVVRVGTQTFSGTAVSNA
jgi:hypothetical protein